MRAMQICDQSGTRTGHFIGRNYRVQFIGLPCWLSWMPIVLAIVGTIALFGWAATAHCQTVTAGNQDVVDVLSRGPESVDRESAGRKLARPLSSGFSGGITSNDFQPLMDLIQSVIDTDSWQDSGGEGAIIDYPAGVFADAASAVAGAAREHQLIGPDGRSHSFRSPSETLTPQRVDDQSNLRTISLRRIQSAIASAAADGQSINPSLENLAGIYRIDYVSIDSENNDVLIAGPAGRWRKNTAGRNVNFETGQPTLQLDDLMVCLQNAFHADGKFGCTIVPKQSALADAQALLRGTSAAPHSRKWRQSLQSALGKQDVIVFGVSPESKVANTIVAADCLMKRIGMGLEPSIDQVPHYFQRVKDSPDAGDGQSLIRWWFTMAMDSISKDAGGRVFKISGNSVKVLSENELLGEQGQRIHTGASDDATSGFAADFTQHFQSLSQKHPVLASLKNVFDLALVANIVFQYDVDNRQRWQTDFSFSRHNAKRDDGYQLVSLAHDTEVDSIMNFESVYFRKQGRRYRKTIVGVSGGVEFDFRRLLASTKQVQLSQSEFPVAFFEKHSAKSEPIVNSASISNDFWWWD